MKLKLFVFIKSFFLNKISKWKYCLSVFVLLSISIAALLFIRVNNIFNLFSCFVTPDRFIETSTKLSIDREKQINAQLANAYNSDPNSRVFAKQSTKQFRESVGKAFITVVVVIIYSLCLSYVVVHHIKLSDSLIQLIQKVSGALILWALLGKLGWPQTWSGDSLPEIINNFWFISLNVVGSLFLFSAYFYSVFKNKSFSIFHR